MISETVSRLQQLGMQPDRIQHDSLHAEMRSPLPPTCGYINAGPITH
jgi:hypothetical protein